MYLSSGPSCGKTQSLNSILGKSTLGHGIKGVQSRQLIRISTGDAVSNW